MERITSRKLENYIINVLRSIIRSGVPVSSSLLDDYYYYYTL